MQLRWLIKQNPVTAKEVDAYVQKHNVARMDAKAILQKREAPVLQMRLDAPDEWVDVPVVIEPPTSGKS